MTALAPSILSLQPRHLDEKPCTVDEIGSPAGVAAKAVLGHQIGKGPHLDRAAFRAGE